MSFCSVTALLLVSFGSSTMAASTLADCVRIDDATARLACYDSVAGRSAVPAGAPAAATAAAVAAAPQASVPAAPVKSGLGYEQLAAPKDEPSQMQAKIVSVAGSRQPGRWTVTLDNGQVWEQRESSRDGRRPKPGDTVTIRKASMSSYLMVMSSGGSSRVGRVQ